MSKFIEVTVSGEKRIICIGYVITILDEIYTQMNRTKKSKRCWGLND